MPTVERSIMEDQVMPNGIIKSYIKALKDNLEYLKEDKAGYEKKMQALDNSIKEVEEAIKFLEAR